MTSFHEPDTLAIRWPAKINHVPKDVFVRQDVYEQEQKRIFRGMEWHGIGHVCEVPNKGDFRTTSIGEVPLLITRDQTGAVHVFYNACSHRGAQLETAESGNKKDFVCPYHRWRFDGAGRLAGTPDPEDYTPGFKRENYPLGAPRFAILHGIIFVTLHADTPPLEEVLEGYVDHVAEVLGGDGNLRLLGYQKLRFKGNWKTYRDNDAYHAPLLHSAFRMLNWQGGEGRQFANARGHRGYVSQLSLPPDNGFLKDPSIIAHIGGGPRTSASLMMFPVFSVIRHMNVINLRYINPRGVDQTDIIFAYFCREEDDEELVRHRIRQSSNLLGPCGMVSMEDVAVFHRLQIGCQTPGQAVFQKGVHDEYNMSYEYRQNDETGNLPAWERYRQVMGFDKEEA